MKNTYNNLREFIDSRNASEFDYVCILFGGGFENKNSIYQRIRKHSCIYIDDQSADNQQLRDNILNLYGCRRIVPLVLLINIKEPNTDYQCFKKTERQSCEQLGASIENYIKRRIPSFIKIKIKRRIRDIYDIASYEDSSISIKSISDEEAMQYGDIFNEEEGGTQDRICSVESYLRQVSEGKIEIDSNYSFTRKALNTVCSIAVTKDEPVYDYFSDESKQSYLWIRNILDNGGGFYEYQYANIVLGIILETEMNHGYCEMVRYLLNIEFPDYYSTWQPKAKAYLRSNGGKSIDFNRKPNAQSVERIHYPDNKYVRDAVFQKIENGVLEVNSEDINANAAIVKAIESMEKTIGSFEEIKGLMAIIYNNRNKCAHKIHEDPKLLFAESWDAFTKLIEDHPLFFEVNDRLRNRLSDKTNTSEIILNEIIVR